MRPLRLTKAVQNVSPVAAIRGPDINKGTNKGLHLKAPKLKYGGKPVTQHVGKGSQMLPGRGALRALSQMPGGADMGDYARMTPSGANAPGTYADIQHMGDQGAGEIE
jgi:hypothetical protein